MHDYMIWAIIGLILIIVEVMTGTFYLLVLGIAAFAGTLAALLEMGMLAQVLATGVVAAIGLFSVHRWHRSRPANNKSDRSLDIGQAVALESWIDQTAKRVRVKYRGTSWDADLVGDSEVKVRDTLYIWGADGNQLKVSRTPLNK